MGYAYYGQPETGWGTVRNSFSSGFMSAFLEKLLNRPSPPDTLYYPLFVSAQDFGYLTAWFLWPAFLYALALICIKTKHPYLLRTIFAIMILTGPGTGKLDIYAVVLLILTFGSGPKEYFSKPKEKTETK